MASGIRWWAPSWARLARAHGLVALPWAPGAAGSSRGLALTARRLQPAARLPAAPGRQQVATEAVGRAAQGGDAEGGGARGGLGGLAAAVRGFLAAAAGALASRWPRPAQAAGSAAGAAAPGARTLATGAIAEKPAEAFSALRDEVAGLRETTPGFLLRLEGPLTAPLALDAEGKLGFPSEGQGPWDVLATFEGNDADEVYKDPVTVRLRFDARWPQAPPSVRVRGLLSFPLLDRARSPPRDFFGRLERDAEGCLRVADVLQRLHRFLLEPVAALGLEEEGADEKALRRAQSWVRDVRRVNEKRMDVIRRYAEMARHPELFGPLEPLRAEWLAPGLWEAAASGEAERWRALLTEHVPGEVYSFPLFSEAFCEALLEEIFGFYASGLPARRPNSMNAYGIILNDIGLEPFVDRLQAFLQPLGHLLFPGAGSAWDGHHCFVVRYREGEDLGLDMHTDDSDVTFNVCLGLDFAGAGLQFCGTMGTPSHRQHSYTYQHQKGRCVVHLGRRRHGADDISSGERLNLILWNHGSVYRSSEEYRHPNYQKEVGPPSPLCTSYTHDRDFGIFKPYPSGKEAFKSRGWCPPPAAEYEGFRADSLPESVEQTLSKL